MTIEHGDGAATFGVASYRGEKLEPPIDFSIAGLTFEVAASSDPNGRTAYPRQRLTSRRIG